MLPSQLDLHLTLGAHELRRRLRYDNKVIGRVRTIARKDIASVVPDRAVILDASAYRDIRHLLKGHTVGEIEFVNKVQNWRVTTPLTEPRCNQVKGWVHLRRDRIQHQVWLYLNLGYTSVDLVLRFGEEGFSSLANCLLPDGGFILTIDYGATTETLLHSSATLGDDNVKVPPFEIPEGSAMPDCHSEWTRCAGLVDWTTFIDFSNLARAGEELGWQPVFYGPQSALEQLTPIVLATSRNERIEVPGYFTLQRADNPSPRSLIGRAIPHWYGHESGDSQHWTSFKLLLQFKAPSEHAPVPSDGRFEGDTRFYTHTERRVHAGHIISAPTFPLTDENIDPCWTIDPSHIALSDHIRRQWPQKSPWRVIAEIQRHDQRLKNLNHLYSNEYQDVQLAMRLVDWAVATHGCTSVTAKSPTFQGARWSPWEKVWGLERVQRVGDTILREIGRSYNGTRMRPHACVVRWMVHHLCNFLEEV